jgi:hypothetical protein
MNFKDIVIVLVLAVLLFITYCFNEVFLLNLRAYNLINIVIYIILILNLLKIILVCNSILPIDVLQIVLIFLSGINIKFKNKLFFFISLLYLYLIFREIYKSIKHTTTFNIHSFALILFQLAISIILFILTLTNFTNLVIITPLLLILLFSETAYLYFFIYKPGKETRTI